MRALPTSVDQFHDPVHHDADPEIHDQSEVEVTDMVTSGRGQMRRQQEKVQKVPDHHRNRLFEQSSQHLLSWTPERASLMPEKPLFAIRFSLFRLLARINPGKSEWRSAHGG